MGIIENHIRDGAIGCRNCGDTFERAVSPTGTVAACEDCNDGEYSLYSQGFTEQASAFIEDFQNQWLSDGKLIGGYHDWLLENLASFAAEAATAALEQAAQWQPMKTAPKNGQKFLAYDSEKKTVWRTYWDKTKWHPAIPSLTHWMPLPEPPIAAIGDD